MAGRDDALSLHNTLCEDCLDYPVCNPRQNTRTHTGTLDLQHSESLLFNYPGPDWEQIVRRFAVAAE